MTQSVTGATLARFRVRIFIQNPQAWEKLAQQIGQSKPILMNFDLSKPKSRQKKAPKVMNLDMIGWKIQFTV